MTFRALEIELLAQLKVAGLEQPELEARALLLELLGWDLTALVMNHDKPASPDQIAQAHVWASRRGEGYPLAYLSGRKGFYKHEFIVAPGVLIPRPETEHVLEVALQRLTEQKLSVHHFADLGCGSGCLGLSLVGELPSARLHVVDASSDAVALTRRNAEALGLEIDAVLSTVENWEPSINFELIVANPPYIAEADPRVQKSVDKYEPHAALYSGADGLHAIRTWSDWSRRHLVNGGIFVCEIGAGQSPVVEDILEGLGFTHIEVKPDLAGHDRVVSALNTR